MMVSLQRVEEIFHEALECESGQLSGFLRQACGDDELLRQKIEDLLSAHRQADGFIERSPVASVSRILEAAETDLLTGQTIDRYRIHSRISSGGMGAVYLALRADQQFEKRVAIKLIKRGMDTDSVLRHFRNERQILANFDHPNIARLLDGGATRDGLPYFVMEYVDGLPIDEYCKTHSLSIPERLTLIRQVCAAVAYAHRHTVIHRDIKPSNILVTGDGTPKLLDFGIAKILQPGGGAEGAMTITGLRLLTPEYASPEQVRGEPVTTATDVYSLGVVLFQLLTGEKPYHLKSRTAPEISRAVVEQEPPRPSTIMGRRAEKRMFNIRNSKLLNGDLDNIVLMALRKEPERRYQSIEQLSDDIQRYLDSRPVIARKDTLTYRTAKFVRRNKTITAAAAVIVLSLVGGIVATSWEAHRARAEEVIAKVEKQRAERRFNDVRQLAHSVLFDYHDAIKDLPGATRVRERLVNDALNYLDSLAAEASGDSALQRELAAAYDRIGDVKGQAYSASFGDRAGAMQSYLKALRIREAVMSSQPHDTQTRRELAESHRRIGWQLRDTNQSSVGVEHLQEAIGLYSELTSEQPQSPEVAEELAQTHNLLGLVYQDLGDWRNALGQHREAFGLREKLVTNYPTQPKYRRGLSATYANMAATLDMGGDIARALENNQKALGLIEALVKEDPSNASYRRSLSIAFGDNGDYRDEFGDKAAALDSFRKSIALYEELAAADPANAQIYGDIGYVYLRAGELLADTGDNSQALAQYRKSVQMYEKTPPENLNCRFQLANSRAGLAKIEAKLGDRKGSIDDSEKSMSLLLELHEEPTHATHRVLRAHAYQYLGETYAELARSGPAAQTFQHWKSARKMFQESFNIYQDMRNRGILSSPDAHQLDEVRKEIANCEVALRR